MCKLSLMNIEKKKKFTLSVTGQLAYDSQIMAYKRSGRGETFADYAEWINEARANQTRNMRIKAVKCALLSHAKKNGQDSSIVKNELDNLFKSNGLKHVKPELKITENDCLNPDQLKAVIALSPKKKALIMTALYHTACRVSEITGIKMSDVKTMKAGCSIKVIGKGSKERTVFLPVDVLNEIKKVFPCKTYLFEPKPGKPYTRQGIHKTVSCAGQKVLKIANLHPHTFRHTWATLNLDRLGLYKVSKYLGHSDVSITAQYYLHNEATDDEILNREII